MSTTFGDKYGHYIDAICDLMERVRYKIQKNILLPAKSEMVIEKMYEQFDDFLPEKNSSVLDIGSQYGDYAIVCNKIYHANVIAFEPLYRNYFMIEKFAKINKANVTIYPFAIGIKDKFEDIHVNSDKLTETIHFVPLDYFNFKNVDLIKIDAEGFEMEVLESGIETIKKYKPKIIIETHSFWLEKEVREKLKELGYECKHEYDWRKTLRGGIIVDLFFAQKVIKNE